MSYSIEAYYRHEHDDQPLVIQTDADVDQLIDELLSETFDHTLAALYLAERSQTDQGYPDHDLRVGVNAERKLGGLKFAGTVDGVEGVWYAVGQTSQHGRVFYEYAGHPEDFALDSEVSLDVLRAAVKDFLHSGGQRPGGVEWRSWPENVG
ncbi:Imm1 family immunity protein [Kribbella sp. NPDC050459]|uniref:Imm1 family immunity protein n=1 Tax=Kribbella sp. NPDC050459 TaxID=3155785 RepID=UPI0033DB53C8